MRIIEPSFKLLIPEDRKEGIEMLQTIERFARISHRAEEKQTEGTWERFIKSVVLEHGDWSVVEHVYSSVIFRVDRGVTHELVRHRLFSFTQECVAGDTRLTGNLTIKQAFDKKCIGRRIRSSNGTEIVHNAIERIFEKGVQPVYAVVTSKGYRIKTTLAHEFQVPGGGFTRLEHLHVGDCVMVNGGYSLLHIDDASLRNLFFKENLCPAEIALRFEVPYSTVTRRLRQLGVFRWRRNDKDLGKYNRQHTPESWEKIRASVRCGYRNGRRVWNKGVKEDASRSVKKQAASLRRNHHNNGYGASNSNWKGGVRKTARNIARRLKSAVKSCEVCFSKRLLEVHHIDENPMNTCLENLIKLCSVCHKRVHSRFRVGVKPIPDRICSIIYVGVEPTFDVEMRTHHNYVANGFVVHNSTRFVNGRKSYPDGLEFIYPAQLVQADNPESWALWVQLCKGAEEAYLDMLDDGLRPQEARSVLPNALAATIAVTGNLRNWRHFFIMRTSKETHPDFKRVTIPLLQQFQERVPLLFDDIVAEERQIDAMRKPR